MRTSLDPYSGLDQVVNLPDLSFVRLCTRCFSINRGIYNTIESWMYERGLVSIAERRKAVWCFLEQLKEESKGQKVVFGSGGLTEKLNQYWEKGIWKKGAFPDDHLRSIETDRVAHAQNSGVTGR